MVKDLPAKNLETLKNIIKVVNVFKHFKGLLSSALRGLNRWRGGFRSVSQEKRRWMEAGLGLIFRFILNMSNVYWALISSTQGTENEASRIEVCQS